MFRSPWQLSVQPKADGALNDPLKFHWYLPAHGDIATIADNTGVAESRSPSHLDPRLGVAAGAGTAAVGESVATG